MSRIVAILAALAPLIGFSFAWILTSGVVGCHLEVLLWFPALVGTLSLAGGAWCLWFLLAAKKTVVLHIIAVVGMLTNLAGLILVVSFFWR